MTWERFRGGWLVVICAILTTGIGCGGKNDGPQRYQRKGKVTFKGQAVAKGEILISPNREKGGKGPGTTVTFEDGIYETREGMGSLSGPHIMVVSGYDGKSGVTLASGEPHPWGYTLFAGHRIEIDFPAEASTHDIDVKD